MRPTVWLTLLVFVVIAAAIHARSSSVRGSGKVPVQINRAAPTSWVVEGKWMPTTEDAINSALEKAEAEVAAYLRGKDPHLAWVPKADYVRDHLQKDIEANEETETLRRIHRGGHYVLEEEKEFQPPLGKMRRARVKVVLGPNEYKAITDKDEMYRKEQRRITSQHRQVLLAKVLAGVVVLLGTAVGYFRLEEATKGYYTTWLRVAALGLLAVVVAGLLFVA